jgi:cytochrome c-type biogenesis protein
MLVFAFLAGSASSVNPCGFAMLPAFASFVLGGTEAGPGGSPVGLRLWRAVRLGTLVTAAFVVVFATAGVVITYVSRAFVAALPWLALAVGAVLAVYGIVVAAGRGRLALRLPNPLEGRGGGSAVLFGVGYAIASLSCTLPVFLVVVSATLVAGGLGSGVAGFVVYAFGMGTIVFAVAISMALARDGLVRWLRRQGRHLTRLSGVLLALAGGYIVLYWATALGSGGPAGASGIVGAVGGISAAASAFMSSTLGRVAVGALAVGVAAATTVGVASRLRPGEPGQGASEEPALDALAQERASADRGR